MNQRIPSTRQNRIPCAKQSVCEGQLIAEPHNLLKETGQHCSTTSYEPDFFQREYIIVDPIKEIAKHALLVSYKPGKLGIIPIQYQATHIELAAKARCQILQDKHPIMVTFKDWYKDMPIFSRKDIRRKGQTFIRQKLQLKQPQLFWACLVSDSNSHNERFLVEIGYGIRATMSKSDFSDIGFYSLKQFLACYGFNCSKFPVVLCMDKRTGSYHASFKNVFKEPSFVNGSLFAGRVAGFYPDRVEGKMVAILNVEISPGVTMPYAIKPHQQVINGMQNISYGCTDGPTFYVEKRYLFQFVERGPSKNAFLRLKT